MAPITTTSYSDEQFTPLTIFVAILTVFALVTTPFLIKQVISALTRPNLLDYNFTQILSNVGFLNRSCNFGMYVLIGCNIVSR
jgi:hypothetical protein